MTKDLKAAPDPKYCWAKRALSAVVALLFGLFLCALSIVSSEGLFHFLNARKSAVNASEGSYDKYFLKPDPVFGYVPHANVHVRHVMKMGGKQAWDKFYTTNDHGYRITPVEHPDARTRFAAFFGCSFTFGEGVNDDETLPFYLARSAPAYMPHNFGCPGYGTQQMLAQLQHVELRSEISQAEGIGIYTFISDHPRRVVGNMSVFWSRGYPCFEERSGGLEYLGSFRTAHPLRTWLYDLFFKSETLRYFKVDLPSHITEGDIGLTAHIIKASAALFQDQFKGSRFYVLIFPGERTYSDSLIKRLAAYGISCLDYRDLFAGISEPIAYADNHPVPRAYQLVARKLVEDLHLDAGMP